MFMDLNCVLIFKTGDNVLEIGVFHTIVREKGKVMSA
jgi:hypothetical protein